MSGLGVVAAVSAVISAFHDGSEQLKHLREKRRNAQTQTQQEFEERQLEDSLETSERQIGFRYAQDMKELGDHIRIGDVIARDRLLHIAVIIQAEIIKSLQVAVKHENAILNLKILHEASIMNRNDTFVTLDELKQRLLATRPLTRQLPWAPNDPTSRSSVSSVHTIQVNDYSPIGRTLDDYVPTAVTLPAPRNQKESKHGLARYFQMKRNNSMSDSSVASLPSTPLHTTGVSFGAVLEHMVKARGTEDRTAIMEDIDDMISSYQSLQVGHKSSDLLNGCQQLARQGALALPNADSTNSNHEAVQIHPNLTPTWDEHGTDGASQHPMFDPSIFGSQDQEQYYSHQMHVANNSFPHMHQQPPHPRGSATSTSSVAHSETHSPGAKSLVSSQNSQAQTPPLSPRTEQPYFSLQQIPGKIPYQEVNNKQCGDYSPPLTPYTLADRTYTLPIAPLSPHQTRQSPAVPPHSSQQTHTLVASQTPLHQISIPSTEEEDSNLDLRSRYHLRSSVACNTSNMLTSQSECITTIPACETSAVAATAISTAPPTAGLRRDSASAPSRTSSDSGLSVSMGILPGRSGLCSSIWSNTIGSGPINGQSIVNGRPCKDNNYWGFCKGAWTVREDVKKGLILRTLPQGMYNTKTIWECQSCSFKGDTFAVPNPKKKNKEDMIVDPYVHTSKAGIRYRWIFLAKSHAKRKITESSHDESNFGCVFCSVEGNVTEIYESVETLMNHIWGRHVADMSERTRIETRCILGRKAGKDESFDINIQIFSSIRE